MDIQDATIPAANQGPRFTFEAIKELRDKMTETSTKSVKIDKEWLTSFLDSAWNFRVTAVETALDAIEREGEAEGLSRQLDRKDEECEQLKASYDQLTNIIENTVWALDDANFFNALSKSRAAAAYVRTYLEVPREADNA